MFNQQQLDNWTYRRFQDEIELMRQAISAYERKIAKPHVIKKLVDECKARIFNAATYIGDFAMAYEYAPTPQDATLVARLAKALSREETDTCKCSTDYLQTLGSPVEIPRFFNWRRIYHQEKAAWIDVYKCSKCNFMTTHPNSVATHSARSLERVRSNSVKTKGKGLQDHEALST